MTTFDAAAKSALLGDLALAAADVARLTAMVNTLTPVVPPVVPPPPPPPVIVPIPPAPGSIAIAPPSAPVFHAAPGDQSAAFAAFLGAHAGQQIALDPAGQYVMDQRTQVSFLHGWTLFMQGATVRSKGLAGSIIDAWLRPIQCENIKLLDGNVIGPGGATVAATEWKSQLPTGNGWARENGIGIKVEGGHNIALERMSVRQFYGDSLYIGRRGAVGTYDSPDGVTLTDCDFRQAGRNAVSLTAGKNVTVTGGYIGDGGLSAWDTEPNTITDITQFVRFTGVHFGPGDVGRTISASHDGNGTGYAVYVSAGKAPARDHSFDRCQFDVGSLYVVANGGRNANIAIRDCTGTKAGDARFAGTDGIVFTGNVGIARVGQ